MRIVKHMLIHAAAVGGAVLVSAGICWFGYVRDFLPEALAVTGPLCAFVSFAFAIMEACRLSERSEQCRDVGPSVFEAACVFAVMDQECDCRMGMARSGVIVDDFDDLLTISYDDVSLVRRDGRNVSIKFDSYEGQFRFGTALRARTVSDVFISRCKNLIDVSVG